MVVFERQFSTLLPEQSDWSLGCIGFGERDLNSITLREEKVTEGWQRVHRFPLITQIRNLELGALYFVLCALVMKHKENKELSTKLQVLSS